MKYFKKNYLATRKPAKKIQKDQTTWFQSLERFALSLLNFFRSFNFPKFKKKKNFIKKKASQETESLVTYIQNLLREYKDDKNFVSLFERKYKEAYIALNCTHMIESEESIKASSNMRCPKLNINCWIFSTVCEFTLIASNMRGYEFNGFVLNIRVDPLIESRILSNFKANVEGEERTPVMETYEKPMTKIIAVSSASPEAPSIDNTIVANEVVNGLQKASPFLSLLSNAWDSLKSSWHAQEEQRLRMKINTLEAECRRRTGRYDTVPADLIPITWEILQAKEQLYKMTGIWLKSS